MNRPVALVTGAGRRVGRAIALELAASGFDLALACRSSRRETREVLVQSGAKGHVFEADFDDPESVGRLGETLAALPRLDAIVHNASSYDRCELGRITDEKLVSHFRVNAAAPLLLTQACAALLRNSTLPGGGAVICLTDIQSQGRPQRGYTAYAMSKAALSQLVDSLAVELAPRVRVIGLAPGVIAWPAGTPPEQIVAYEAKIPLGRSGTPQDAAKAVAWLIKDAAYITGEIIRLDGGRWLR